MNANSKAAKDPGDKKVASKFMMAIRRMLDENDPSPAVSWTAGGDSFFIQSEEAFLRLLPKYFKTKNFSSFVRQLNMYDFKKQKNEKGFHEFKQPLFLRDAPQLLPRIVRKVNEKPHESAANSTASHTKPPEARPGQITQSSINEILQELDNNKKSYQARITKLLAFVFLLGVKPELVAKVQELFNGLESQPFAGDEQLAFKSLIEDAAERIFKKDASPSLDELLLLHLGQRGFDVLFPSQGAEQPEAMPQLFDFVLPKRTDDSHVDRSIKLKDDGFETPKSRNLYLPAMVLDFSDCHSDFDRQEMIQRVRNQAHSLLTPNSEKR